MSEAIPNSLEELRAFMLELDAAREVVAEQKFGAYPGSERGWRERNKLMKLEIVFNRAARVWLPKLLEEAGRMVG